MAPISPRGLTYGFSLAKAHWLSKFKPQHAFFGGLVSLSKYHHYLRIKKGTHDHVRPVGHLHPHPHPPTPIRGLMNTAAPREEQVELPGFGKPIPDIWSSSEAFPHPLANGRLLESKGVTLRERRMLDFIGSISDKPEWDRKVFDEAVITKWRGEAMSRPTVEDNDVYMSESMFENCIKELQDKALRFRETGFIHALDTELTVVKSDTAVSQELAEALRVNSRRLEDVAESAKDWHPRSDNLVLDLLHPSLFPVVFGTTRALPTGQVTLDNCFDCIGAGELTSAMAVKDHEWGSYQWLPSDIRFTPSRPKLTSYINNLHPHVHRSLYPVLEAFVAAAIPLWEESLSWFDDRRRLKIEATDDSEFSLPEGVKYDIPPRASAGAFADDVSDEFWLEEYHKETDEYQEWWLENRVLAFPEPDPFLPFAKQVDLAKRVSLRQQFPDGIQVIFKLANIHLTPEKPEYGGGSWHIEGGLTERVCASALYYYDEDNITPSRLAFRQKADVEHLIMIPSLQDKYHSLEAYLGIKQEDSAIQELGSVLTRQGRMLVFPNALQHQVQPFRLQDASRPGHRKILAMFLIEPGRRILSTSNVPPQRKDWWEPQVRKIPAFAALPQEIFDSIMGHFDYPLSWEAALEIREKLMDERSRITKEVNDTLHEEYFAFCEH